MQSETITKKMEEYDITISNGRWCVIRYDAQTDSWTTVLVSVSLSCRDRDSYRYLRSLLRKHFSH